MANDLYTNKENIKNDVKEVEMEKEFDLVDEILRRNSAIIFINNILNSEK